MNKFTVETIIALSVMLLTLGVVLSINNYLRSDSYKARIHNHKVLSQSHQKINRDISALRYSIHTEAKR